MIANVIDLSRRAFFLRSEPPPARVAVSQRCLALNGIYCESCRDTCEAGALRFVLQMGGVSKLLFDAARCTQCGECVQRCPQGAIVVQPRETPLG